ncbi:DNA polymerase [Coemansia reversa NRRL 1564]|uniref:DNA polymerase n=1 Tax=Coemansia reversa (strain ATCC 12441 / NRRL 1564) TaxID=763665 RepID=A0A2G5B1G5_COERN|nr:DNA polymerase [Coemansia reversa NRRL 1564]|eukprot:PIA12557.1 DNA polymerase [Coemansia reversa NRRL 1564]
MPEGVFDKLPDIAKQAMIQAQQYIIDAEKRETEHAPIIEEHRKRQEYQERQARAAALSREQLKASGIAERVGYDTTPRKMVSIEEDHIDLSSEFSSNEPSPVPHLGGLVHGFRRSTIEEYARQAQDILDRARSHRDVQRSAHAYMLFHIWTGTQNQVGTRLIVIGDYVSDHVNELYEALNVLLNDIEDKAGAYEFIYSGENKSYVHFYFKANYFPNPHDSKNWGKDIMTVENREYFDIFTANFEGIDCVLQVARRIWPEAKESSIKEIIERAKGKVCIVKPYSGIQNISQIRDYSDLVVESQSPLSLAVIDSSVIYLLHFNEHLGLLENVKQPRRNPRHTKFRPVQKYPKTKKITMCFDIECYFDPHNDQRHIPYLCCACFVYDIPINSASQSCESKVGNVVEFEGKDCIAQMIEYAADNVNEFGLNNIELIAHNGGAYDFHYLLTSMFDPSIVKNILLRNNHFITFSFKHDGVTFSVKDSYNFLCCSLQNAAKAFLTEHDRKTDFPHHEIRTADDLQKVFQEWLSVERNIAVTIEKEKMLVTSEYFIDYKEDGKSKKLIDWAKTYCVNDVIVLAKVWVRFKQTVADVFECEIVDQTLTLAGMSFRLFEAHLPTVFGNIPIKVKLQHPKKVDFFNMRKSLIGGRCISVNGIYQDVVCLDVKSLYPAAMAYYDQPYGNYRMVTSEIPGELGIYYCKVKPSSIDGHGFFPLKYNDDVQYNSVKEEYKGWYTSVDMEIGRQEGHTIIPVPFNAKYVGYSWRHRGKIFREYIESVLYRLKLHYEQAHMPEHRHVIKIVMNSLWGKFAQKWMDTSYNVINEHEVNNDDNAQKIFDTNYVLVKSEKDIKFASKPVQNGVFVLSWARYHMYKLWNVVAKHNAICIYSDTDSMMIKQTDIIKEAKIEIDGLSVPVIGDKMGQLEVECNFNEFISIGKKQYIGKYGDLHNPKYKKRFKGVPLQYITPELYTHLIEGKEAQIQFLKFKREWGAVKGYIESKTVTAT